MNIQDAAKLANLLPPLLQAVSAAAQLVSTTSAVPKALDLIAAAVNAGGAAINGLADLTKLVNQMVDEGREPTAEEWAAVEKRSDDAHSIIQNADLSE